MTFVEWINQQARRLPAWPIYIVGGCFPVWLLWLAVDGGLGVDPIKQIEERLGLWGLKLIVAGLCVTPLRRFAGLNLIKYRRAIGVLAFFYIVLHFLAWLVLDLELRWEQALGDIVKRPYITVGMTALLLLVPLAATSNNWSVRRLGVKSWRRLHVLVYPIAILGAVHFIWLVKAWPATPIVYLAVVLSLLALRATPRRRRVVS